jgi:hypothetical protein
MHNVDCILDKTHLSNFIGLVVYENPLFFKELEQIEEHWRQESRDLVAMVTRLQEENRKLSSSLAERQDHSPEDGGDYQGYICQLP